MYSLKKVSFHLVKKFEKISLIEKILFTIAYQYWNDKDITSHIG